MQEYYFQAKELTVGYEGVPLLRDVTFRIKKGEILTLIGPNGAGKSTILKSIIGQLALISGVVFLEKSRLNEMTEKERAKRVSIVLTEKISPDFLTVREIVEMGRVPYTGRFGVLQDRDKEIVAQAMERIHVADLADREFLHLSDGQKQRVMLAKAIAQEPEILVLDEPVSYLDIGYQMEFLKLLKEMSEKEKLTVIMSMHELDQAEWISDRLLCIKGTHIDRFGRADEIFRTGYISELYGVEARDLEKLGHWRLG